MLFVRLFAIASLALWLVMTSSASEDVGKTPLPKWVDAYQEIPALPNNRKAAITGGIAYLLRESQVQLVEGGYDHFYHLAFEITERSGLEDGARIAPSFDPEYDTLNFHFIRIIRDGELLELLDDAEIELIRKEDELDNGLINGEMTALIELTDVRVGDVVEYGYSWRVGTPLWPGHYFRSVGVEWSVPLILQRYRIDAPADTPVYITPVETNVNVRRSILGDSATYTLEVRDPDPIISEARTPRDQIDHGFVSFSTMGSWSEVVDWAIPVYRFEDPLPSEFTAVLDEIDANYSDEKEKIVEVLRWVQSEIRYLGLESGLGSHAPRAPGTTLQRRYGDCKDKTVLLVAALNYLGIEAYPALTHSDGEDLHRRPPMIHAFDHVITEIVIDDENWWVDPTLSLRGGSLGELAYLPYGYALPLKAGQSDIEALPEPFPSRPTAEIIETYTMPEDGDIGLDIRITNRFENFTADQVRMSIANSGEERFARDYLDYYAQYLPGLETASETEISDSLDENVISITEHYSLSREDFEKNGISEELPIRASAVRDVLPTSVEADRRSALALPRGINKRHVVNIVTPGRILSGIDDTVLEESGVRYERRFRNEGDTLTINYLIEVTEPFAERSRINDIIGLSDTISETSFITINSTAAEPTLARRLGIDDIDPDIEETITQALNLIDEERYVPALGKLNNLLDEVGSSGKLYGYVEYLRAWTLSQLDRNSAALKAFDNAFANYEPDDTGLYFNYLNLMWETDRVEDVIKTTIRMLNNHPDSIQDMNMDWLSDLIGSLKQAEWFDEYANLTIAAASAQHQQDDTFDHEEWVYADAVTELIKQEKRDEVREYVTRFEDPFNVMKLMTIRKTEWLWSDLEEQAGKDLGLAAQSSVAAMDRARKASPDDYGLQRDYLRALRNVGRNDDALAFGKPIIEDWGTIEAVGEDAAWFVNDYAYALLEDGQNDEAVKLMSKLLSDGVNDAYLIPMAVNRAGILLDLERYQQAMGSALLTLGAEDVSDYGKVWLYSVVACANHRLGNEKSARTLLEDKIKALKLSNMAGYTQTLLCLEQYDEAEEAYIERFSAEDAEFDIPTLLVMQRTRKPANVPPLLLELQERAEKVKSRKRVQKAYAEIARILELETGQIYWSYF